jgi:small subunit ribosomal protein S6
MFILDSNRYARDPGGVSGRIPQMVEEFNGEMLANRLWNEQKLAFPINGHRKGTYWLSYFRMDSRKVADFNRACQLNEDVLRNLTLKVDPRLVDTLVAHARGEPLPTPAAEQPAGDKAAEPKSEDTEEAEPAATSANESSDSPD